MSQISNISDISVSNLPRFPLPEPVPPLLSRTVGPKSDSDLLKIFSAVMVARERLQVHHTDISKVPSKLYEKFMAVMQELYPRMERPTHRCIRRMMATYKSEGVLRKKRTGGKVAKNYDDAVRSALTREQECCSIRKARMMLEEEGVVLHRKTVAKIAHKLKMVAMKPNRGQALDDRAFERRFQFAEEFLYRMDNRSINLENVCFSDESYFATGYHSNRHNEVVWRVPGAEADSEMEAMREDLAKHPEEVHVFAALHSKIGVVGPFFIDEIPDAEGKLGSRILTGFKYVWLLENKVFPVLRERLGDDFNTMVWQQDGAPPHTSREALNFLFNTLGEERVISSRRSECPPGRLEWPPYSPDLTPLDFWFWAGTKEAVGLHRPSSISALKGLIKAEMRMVMIDDVADAIDDVPNRLRCCVHTQGKHIEGRVLSRFKTLGKNCPAQESCIYCQQKHNCYCEKCVYNCKEALWEVMAEAEDIDEIYQGDDNVPLVVGREEVV